MISSARTRLRWVLLASTAGLALSAGSLAPAQDTAPVVAFTKAGDVSYTVPEGVDTVEVVVLGGGGGASGVPAGYDENGNALVGDGGAAGSGALVRCKLDVDGGDKLSGGVGSAGSGGTPQGLVGWRRTARSTTRRTRRTTTGWKPPEVRAVARLQPGTAAPGMRSGAGRPAWRAPPAPTAPRVPRSQCRKAQPGAPEASGQPTT
ncbi:glycine-rich domain-containing protein [Streptomyces virginiae]